MPELNPIITHEMRSRWRGWRDFAIMFAYSSLLALAVGMLYASQVNFSTVYESQRRMAAVGHELFIGLTITQIVGWMLLAPSLTATSIAGEREHGMLDLLLLAPLGPWRIASGKLFATLAFAFLLMLAPLPIISLCFLMGGVSPDEFRIVALLELTTAATGAAIGLFTSAWCRRVSTALGLAFAIVFVWGLGSVIARAIVDAGWFKGTSVVEQTITFLLDLLWRTNPVVAAVEPYPATWSTIYGLPFDVPAWAISIALQLMLSLALFLSTLRALRQPLQEAEEEPQRDRRPRIALLRRRVRRADEGRPEPAPRPGVWWEHPLHSRIHYANPVLQREVQRKLRWRRLPARVRIPLLMLAAGMGYGYLRGLYEALSNRRPQDFYFTLTMIALLIVIITAAGMGAVAFAREREANTWESLRMSLLTPWEIIAGKLLGPLLFCDALAMSFWMLAAPGISAWVADADRWRMVSLTQAASILVITLTTVWFCVCWGLFISWSCRKIWVAMVSTIASLLCLYALVPTLLSVGAHDFEDMMMSFLRFWHPLFGFICAVSPSSSYHHQPGRFEVTVEYALTQLIMGGLLLGRLHHNVKLHLRHSELADFNYSRVESRIAPLTFTEP